MRISPRLAVPLVAAITALFLLEQGSPAQTGGPTLTVRVAGGGSVTSEPRGIACEPLCSAPFPRTRSGPQVVQLTATPAPGQQLEGWGESCSGVAATCTVVMSADRVVTARFGPAPPRPPEAPPGSANLTVIASAGGAVSGPGIACPADCVESLALGSSAPMSATPGPGYRFEGWQGACSGQGGCAAQVGGPTLVRAEFAPLRRAVPLLGDARSLRDLCPDTPQGVKGGADGCGPLDPLFHGGLILERLEGAGAEAIRALRGVPGTKSIPSALRHALALMQAGATKAGRGDACAGAAGFGKGAGSLTKAVRRGTALLSREQRRALDGSGPADTGPAQLGWAALHGAKLELAQAAGRARAARKLFDGACKELGRRLNVRGRIKDLDDATGLLTLDSGKQFLLPEDGFGNRVAAGSLVMIGGLKTDSGPDLVDAVEPAKAPDKLKAQLSPCMELRIAPFQNFLGSSTPVLHHPAGYRSGGELWLEGGTRLAASAKCTGRPGRYSLAIELRLGSSSLPITVAADLTDKDAPVELPLNEINFGTLVVRERRQLSNCPPPSSQASAAKSFPCPVVEVSKTEYKLRVRQTGFYAKAVFDKTVFGLEVQSPAPAKVTGLTGVHPTLPASASFAGRGYKPTANGAPGPMTSVAQNELFALWPRETYGWDGILFPMMLAGVDHYAGLFWPSVVGKRNGKPFRYAAELPDLVTDRLALCQGTEDCFYKPPWPLGVEYGTVQGNGPGFSHNGNQLYAFDFSVPEGGELVAARGGVVGDVVENLSKNYNPCVDKNADGPANYVRIDHEDGTFGYYAHLKKDTVSPTVGDRLKRGDPVGQAGNTGRSCGPHLHFQSSVTSGSTYYGQTLRIRFNTLLEGEDTPVDCFIPQTDDVLTSTNG